MLIRLIYTLLLALASPILLFGLYKSKPNKPKFGPRWKEHFGITPKLNTDQRPIWIHAVSVGESIAAAPLIKALKKQNPEQAILVTTTTGTGAEQVAKLGDLVEHRYMPIDFSFAVKGFLKAVNPKQMLIIETELWPNTLNTVHKAGIPITVVNARLSEKSCRNYAKVQPLFNLLHPKLTQVLCQTESDSERFSRLGVDSNKLSVTGSIKFDIQISDDVKTKGKELRSVLGEHRPVWIAASTHKGEDEQVLNAHKKLLESYPEALLILVPRHPERFDSVFELCQKHSLETIRRTSQSDVAESTQVYLGDTMGEMLILIGAADVCFMGGSLIGDKVGGHNVLEPAALGVPVITGPSYFNFTEIVASLSQTESLSIIEDSSQLAESITDIFFNPRKIANSALGATESPLAKTIQLLVKE
ncbi:lipid IV(A) 3-deoxy-D-manno-octulosonic acid transferase [Vibrio natriegens]|uniref:3-deoxy-D-manno-octulosonic acid transferase n=1 Tax=Vibrio natriegens NBRC 15636 = ATCC 14048 = DSM 759 TaxID=1219067 RepID=A0AAN0Y0Y6_VIBNA|nr:lipid IV(A) 3-deoxy-D-manno-octulosonic acid transferase [Vibrio natriegens]ALR16724.1 3-deoxy-D-manno-octulosonic acid transferase [Vibrio natriegens NBRC 15636 = ATCC 14048 = DSM 759]ANQ11410.1 3-deoxy-D-manno-octulosonic acid transferase [Vibrio natriegens NBRC 15636 = ATCC 14048 = DSM 759]EPM38973.1 3-deoxy-D-manno-octulosonic acid transferase [Vibrio natriegens NBRC 15636 = ATCC 14048 = DSM 759]MDX6025738.1 lipid IV(A) 3-deoxy-D-manno-octulosonic acid transferase [Vibrio natriegens NBRC